MEWYGRVGPVRAAEPVVGPMPHSLNTIRAARASSARLLNLELTRFDGHLTSPTLRAEVFNEQTKQGQSHHGREA